MKKLVLILLIAAGIFSTACKNDKKAFNPQDRTTVALSDEAKDEAIARLKAESAVNFDSLLNSTNVRMSVLPPASDELTDGQKELMAVKMLQILTRNGIGGINNVPGFALTARITPASKSTTGTAPQKYLVNYDVNYAVLNTVSGDVYGTCATEIEGVGNSFQQAAGNALQQISATAELDAMLARASQKIIDWYNNNLPSLKSQISAAQAKGDYALALALIESVPAEATEAFAYVGKIQSDVENKFMLNIASGELAAMKQAILQSDDQPDEQVYAHYKMISPSSPVYKEATSALAAYEKAVKEKRAAESSQRQANLEAERQDKMRLAEMETGRIKAKYQAQATEQSIRLFLSQGGRGGFWSNLGARIIGAIDGTNWQYKVKDKPYTED